MSLLHHLVFHIYLSLFPCSHLNLCIQKIRQRICLTVIHKPTVWIKELNSVLSFIFAFHCFIYIFICLLAPASFQKQTLTTFSLHPLPKEIEQYLYWKLLKNFWVSPEYLCCRLLRPTYSKYAYATFVLPWLKMPFNIIMYI